MLYEVITDLATLIYTSGTTGPPKGVQLSYQNLFSLIGPAAEIIDLPDQGHVSYNFV